MKILARVLAVTVACALYAPLAIATDSGNLSDSFENPLGNTMAEATESHINTKTDSSPENANEISKLERCQTLLKKIDKLSIEVLELEQHLKNDYGNGASERNKRKLDDLKLRSLKAQVKRYKTEAKENCPLKYLRNSLQPKKQGVVKRK